MDCNYGPLVVQQLEMMYPGMKPIERYRQLCQDATLMRSFPTALILAAGREAGLPQYVEISIVPLQTRDVGTMLALALHSDYSVEVGEKTLIHVKHVEHTVGDCKYTLKAEGWFDAFVAVEKWRKATDPNWEFEEEMSVEERANHLIAQIPTSMHINLNELIELLVRLGVPRKLAGSVPDQVDLLYLFRQAESNPTFALTMGGRGVAASFETTGGVKFEVPSLPALVVSVVEALLKRRQSLTI